MPDDDLSQSNTQPTPEEPDISREDVDDSEDSSFSEKSKKFRVALGIVGLLLVLAAIPTAAYLVRQRQELRKRAAIADPCKVCSGGQCVTIATSPNCTNNLNECSSNANCVTPTPAYNSCNAACVGNSYSSGDCASTFTCSSGQIELGSYTCTNSNKICCCNAPAPTSAPSCDPYCTSWTAGSCGGSCANAQRQYTRSCAPQSYGCSTSKCEADSTCTSTPTLIPTPNPTPTLTPTPTPTSIPYSLTLSASNAAPACGVSSTLTVTANRSVSYPLSLDIYQMYQISALASCTEATTCTVSVSSGTTVSNDYIAYIKSDLSNLATSNQVAINWNCSAAAAATPTPTTTLIATGGTVTPTPTPTSTSTKPACTTQCQQSGRTNAWGECRNTSNCPAEYYTSTDETYCSPSSLACCCIVPTSTPTPPPGGQTPDQVCTALCTVEFGHGTEGGCTSPLNLRGWDLVHGGDSTSPMINPCAENGLWNQCRCNPATYPGGATPTPTPTGGVVIVVGPTTPTPTPTPAFASLNFRVKFQGIASDRTDVLTKTVKVIVGTYTFNNVIVTSGQGMVFTGTVENMTPSAYDVYIKGWAHLQKKFANVTLNSGANNQDFTTIVLKAGDINGDNVINALDYNAVVEQYGQGAVAADLNLDGHVNALDYNLVIENYLQTGE